MSPSELLDLHDQLCQRAKALMETKNRDYRGATQDPFANFRGAGFLGIEPIVGIALRMMDKLQRVRAFATTGTLAVKSESFDDAALDLINYAILMVGMARERELDGAPPEFPRDKDPIRVGQRTTCRWCGLPIYPTNCTSMPWIHRDCTGTASLYCSKDMTSVATPEPDPQQIADERDLE